MVFEILKSIENVILNNYSISEKIQTCFIHVCLRTHTMCIYVCLCEF